jgi:hypothetical protein
MWRRLPARRNQPNKQLSRFEPGVVIGPAVNNDAVHHNFDPLAIGLRTTRNQETRAKLVRLPARPRTLYAKLSRDGGDRDASE